MLENQTNKRITVDVQRQSQNDQKLKNSKDKTHSEKLRYGHADEIYE
ncbi:hypothetical protein [Aquibacillus sediminis]|nr:hypothetical protein [Aquibacillus sediminis]